MPGLEVKVDTSDFDRMARSFAEIGVNMQPALRRAVNHTGDKARTQIARALASQTGLKYGKVREQLTTYRASGMLVLYRIVARGGWTSLKEFAARQLKGGVSAAPWGTRRVFPHAFISPALGGHVFVRIGKQRTPLKKLWGPAVPAEMVKGQSLAAFESTVAAELPARLDHEVGAILKGRT